MITSLYSVNSGKVLAERLFAATKFHGCHWWNSTPDAEWICFMIVFSSILSPTACLLDIGQFVLQRLLDV